jgi:hypothetical protein
MTPAFGGQYSIQLSYRCNAGAMIPISVEGVQCIDLPFVSPWASASGAVWVMPVQSTPLPLGHGLTMYRLSRRAGCLRGGPSISMDFQDGDRP